jgi:hypothetical protein
MHGAPGGGSVSILVQIGPPRFQMMHWLSTLLQLCPMARPSLVIRVGTLGWRTVLPAPVIPKFQERPHFPSLLSDSSCIIAFVIFLMVFALLLISLPYLLTHDTYHIPCSLIVCYIPCPTCFLVVLHVVLAVQIYLPAAPKPD